METADAFSVIPAYRSHEFLTPLRLSLVAFHSLCPMLSACLAVRQSFYPSVCLSVCLSLCYGLQLPALSIVPWNNTDEAALLCAAIIRLERPILHLQVYTFVQLLCRSTPARFKPRCHFLFLPIVPKRVLCEFLVVGICYSYKFRNMFHSFIHSFNHSGYFYSAYSSPLLLRGAPDTARILCRYSTPKRHRQLRVKDLPKVLAWRLERETNPRPFGRKASTLPMRHHVPRMQCILRVYNRFSVCLRDIGYVCWCLVPGFMYRVLKRFQIPNAPNLHVCGT